MADEEEDALEDWDNFDTAEAAPQPKKDDSKEKQKKKKKQSAAGKKKLTKAQKKAQEALERKREAAAAAFAADKEAQLRAKADAQKAVEEADNAITNELFAGVSDGDEPDETAETKQSRGSTYVERNDDAVDDFMGGDLSGSDVDEDLAEDAGTSAAAARDEDLSLSSPTEALEAAFERQELNEDRDFKELAATLASLIIKSTQKHNPSQRKQQVFLKELVNQVTGKWPGNDFHVLAQGWVTQAQARKKEESVGGKKKKKTGPSINLSKGAASDDLYADFM